MREVLGSNSALDNKSCKTNELMLFLKNMKNMKKYITPFNAKSCKVQIDKLESVPNKVG
jgi:hypothetical protein